MSIRRLFLQQAQAVASTDFIIEVNATDSTFTIPTIGGGYLYDVTTSDGQSINGNTGNLTITFPSAGTYDINISGIFPQIYFNNTGDKLKLTDIKNWGNIAWADFNAAFDGCANLTAVTATDAPDLSNSLSWFRAFYACSNMTSMNVATWDMSNITSLSNAFRSCVNLSDLDVKNWNVSSVTVIKDTFRLCPLFDYSLANWDINQVTNFAGILQASTLSTPNYDATLISWAAQAPVSGISTNFGGSQYTLGGAAEAARNTLINTYGWTIADGGGI